jgi:D-alanyl-D-alanine dipeptidase
MNFLYLKKLISPLFFLLPLLLSILLFGNSSIPKRYIAPAAQLPGSRPDSSQWKELIRMDPTLVLDIRYASTNNFIGEKIYDCAKCYLRPAVAEALLKAVRLLPSASCTMGFMEKSTRPAICSRSAQRLYAQPGLSR